MLGALFWGLLDSDPFPQVSEDTVKIKEKGIRFLNMLFHHQTKDTAECYRMSSGAHQHFPQGPSAKIQKYFHEKYLARTVLESPRVETQSRVSNVLVHGLLPVGLNQTPCFRVPNFMAVDS